MRRAALAGGALDMSRPDQFDGDRACNRAERAIRADNG